MDPKKQQDTPSFVVYPIGTVQSPITERTSGATLPADPELRKKEMKALRQKLRETVSQIHVDEKYEPMLKGLSGFSHIMVVFWPHLLDESERQKETVHPRGMKELPLQGIFATRSPARPNPVLITTVQLIRKQGRTLHVKGLDAVNGSPVVDIKPVIKPTEELRDFKAPDWVEKVLG